MRKINGVIAFGMALLSAGLAIAETQEVTDFLGSKMTERFVQCRTYNGNIIIVQGNKCPAGSVYAGEG